MSIFIPHHAMMSLLAESFKNSCTAERHSLRPKSIKRKHNSWSKDSTLKQWSNHFHNLQHCSQMPTAAQWSLQSFLLALTMAQNSTATLGEPSNQDTAGAHGCDSLEVTWYWAACGGKEFVMPNTARWERGEEKEWTQPCLQNFYVFSQTTPFPAFTHFSPL